MKVDFQSDMFTENYMISTINIIIDLHKRIFKKNRRSGSGEDQKAQNENLCDILQENTDLVSLSVVEEPDHSSSFLSWA